MNMCDPFPMLYAHVYLLLLLFLQSQIHWTYEVEKCLVSQSPVSSLRVQYASYVENLALTASLLKSEGLVHPKRSIISSLLTLDVHDRDVITALIARNVASNRDFEWTR
jgi:dynein heavy chain